MVHIPLSTGERPAYLARPQTEGPHPGVLVIHDLIGFMPDTKRHCQRFAEAGYVALAPDLYDGGRMACVVRTVLDMGGGRSTLQVLAAARAYLADLPEVDAQRLAVIGFCMGGGFALLCAADGAYAVAAPFYGVVPKSKDRLAGICPTLAQYGDDDLLFRSHAKRLSKHLKALGVAHEVLSHSGVGHSFMNNHDSWQFGLGRYTPMRAAYNARVEAEAWDKMLRFFDTHLSNVAPTAR